MCARYAGASYAQVLNHFSTKFSLKSMTFILLISFYAGLFYSSLL